MHKRFQFRTMMLAVACSALMSTVLLGSAVSPAFAIPAVSVSAHTPL